MKTDPLTIGLIVFATIILGVYYYRQISNWAVEQKNLTWPVKIANCPDYWNEKSDGTCENVMMLPTATCSSGGEEPLKTVNFQGGVYLGEEGDVKKCNWSKQCNTSWEGIDNLCA
tara:strand:- start:143 stop:487 length:345 start_codon:yes stop_codon:yes gene_type:complete